MDPTESAASAVPAGVVAMSGDGPDPEPTPVVATEAAPACSAAPPGVPCREQVLVLQTTNTAATLGPAQTTPPHNLFQLVTQSGQSYQNGLLNLALSGQFREDVNVEPVQLAPEEVASISSYSSVSSPEILSPNPRTPELPPPDTLMSDTECSLIHRAEDLNINTGGTNESPWILLGKRDSAPDSGEEGSVRRYNGDREGVYDLSGAICSSQFIFTKFGNGSPGIFTSTSFSSAATSSTTTSNASSTRVSPLAVTSTPPAKRLKQPSLSVPHPAKVGPYELKILSQPEEQHRARYLTEGSRGSVKDRSGTSYPTLQLVGYDGPATLQVFVGCDAGKVKPHGFYQACKVYGKSANQFEETEIDGTQVIEIQMEPDNDMRVCIDCVGILKLRNADVEARIGSVRSKKRSNRARLVFRVQLHEPDGSTVTLQTASQPILCTQPVGQPEISRMSLASAHCKGGVDLFLVGKNFLKGSKVYFREINEKDETVWEKEGQIDPEYFHQMHIICTVPPYDRHIGITEPRGVSVVVDSGGRVSEPCPFTYTPGPQDKHTQTAATQIRQSYPATAMVQCGPPADVSRKRVVKMETETSAITVPVSMDTSTALSSGNMFTLDIVTSQSQPAVTPSHGGAHTRPVNPLDEDSPTSSKPAGMLMDSDPMVSSTISMGVTPPSHTGAFPLASDMASSLSTNETASWSDEPTNQTPTKDTTHVFVDPIKVESQSWSSDNNTVTKMDVSHETYKSVDQWQSSSNWNESQASNTQWTAETNGDNFSITKSDYSKTETWNESSQTLTDSTSGFENSWNSVIEVPQSSAQWEVSASSDSMSTTEHRTFTTPEVAPEMALAPKEFSTNYAKEPASRPLVQERPNDGTVVFTAEHGRKALLISANDLVQDARTLLVNSGGNLLPASSDTAVYAGDSTNQSELRDTSTTLFKDTSVGQSDFTTPSDQRLESQAVLQGQGQGQETTLQPVFTSQSDNSFSYTSQNQALTSPTLVYVSHAPAATTDLQCSSTSLPPSGATGSFVLVRNSQDQSSVVRMVPPQQVNQDQAYQAAQAVVGQDQSSYQASPAVVGQDQSSYQASPAVVGQDQASYQAAPAVVGQDHAYQAVVGQDQAYLAAQAVVGQDHAYQAVVGQDQAYQAAKAVVGQDQAYQATNTGQSAGSYELEGSAHAPMVLEESQPTASGHELKDGLSGGTLPTISIEEVCDILRDDIT